MQVYRIKLFLLYLLLIAGGLWHVLDVFQSPMRTLAVPIIIGISLWLVYEYWNMYALPLLTDTEPPRLRRKTFLLWSAGVAAGGLIVEGFGVRTGWIFGHYNYGTILAPFIGPVPIAIGFAWLGMMLCSIAIVTRSTPRSLRLNPFAGALMTALFMMIFDVLMEPAAVALGYWSWVGNSIPLQNYVAWFAVSFVFAYIGFSLRLFAGKAPPVGLHAYFAQVLYFALVSIGHHEPT